MRRSYWESGNWNAVCDVCGFKYKASALKQRWDGLMVCPRDFEMRHPQELIRPIPDQQRLPWTRPEGTDTFPYARCTLTGLNSIPGLGTPGCMIPGFDDGARGLLDTQHNA